jgi:Flp pilus assembly protein TadD
MRTRLQSGIAASFIALAALACGKSGPVPESVHEKMQTDPAAALGDLEAIERQHPQDFDVRMAVGEAHYKLARKALEQHDEATYLRHLEQATDQFIDAAELRPADPGPHIYLAMVAAYRDDMKGALTSLRRARQLAPVSPVSYTNLAEVYIYLDDLSRADAMLERARRLGGPGPYVERNEMLAAWKRGDMDDARDLFGIIHDQNPDALQTWNEALVTEPIDSFEGFVKYCCGDPTCGPYMRGPCEKARQEVAEREVTLETLRREQQIARESREKLRKVYQGQREVTIEGEEPDAPAKDAK